MTPPKIYTNFIDGEWVASASGRTFENVNPANRNELVGLFQKSGPQDVDAAIAAAKQAYKSWKNTPPPKRGEILYRAATLLQEKKENFAEAMTREMGKVLEETRGDVQEAIDMTFYMAGEGRRLFGQTTTSELPNKFCMTVRSPLGVCGLITPWNFPMAIPSWKIMPALICGNTVVLKPATDTPLSSYNLVQVLEEAGVPRGVVNLVTGTGGDVGSPLMRHHDVRAVSFTGSTEIGRKVSQACAASFKHCCLEMGGKNVIMVLDDANLDLAVEGALWGGFGTTGQRCTATSRVVVQKGVYKEFVDRFVARARAPEGRQRPGPDGAGGSAHQRSAAADRGILRRDGKERRRQAPVRRPAPDRRRVRPGLVLCSHHFRRLRPQDAHRPGGNLRPRRLRHPLR